MKTKKCIETARRSVQRMSDEVGSISLAVSEGRINAKQLEHRLIAVQETLGNTSDRLAEMLAQMEPKP